MCLKKYSLMLNLMIVLMLFVFFSYGIQVLAWQQDFDKEGVFFEMSIEELMKLEVLVSDSRLEQKLQDLSVPVIIITAEDIHYSSLTTIREIFQFTPVMDVLQLDRNRYAIGVRGLYDFISERTLPLINGRIANSPLFGGSELNRLPVLLEDIERIEVVCGPSGAAWGVNAFA